VYEISPLPVGRDASADVVFSEFLPAAAAAQIAPHTPAPAYGDVVTIPYKRLTLDVLVHPDAWRGSRCSVHAYDAVARGRLDVPRPERRGDRLDLDVDVHTERLDRTRLELSRVPEYFKIITQVTRPHGWDLTGFRRHWCEVAYPVYGSHVMMAFAPPPRA
jgi:hypothetical protein